MTTQPKDLMTLEDRINAIINNPQFEKELCMRGILLPEFQCDWRTFGGFDGLPEKYKAAILATERMVAAATVMPLEEVITRFFSSARPMPQGAGGQVIGQESYRLVYTGAQLETLLEKVRSALHHLEAGKVVYCENGLRPCPFCGSRAEIVKARFFGEPDSFSTSWRDLFSRGCWVACRGDTCDVRLGFKESCDEYQGGDFETEEEARRAWNGSTTAPTTDTQG